MAREFRQGPEREISARAAWPQARQSRAGPAYGWRPLEGVQPRGLAAEDTVEQTLLVLWVVRIWSRTGAALVEWHALQRVFNVLAAALPGWLAAAGAGDLVTHGGYLPADAAARLSKFAADSIVG